MTQAFLMPNDTCFLLAPTAQVPPSLAHFEKPLGQSAANAGAALQSKVVAALAIRVLRFMASPFLQVRLGVSCRSA